MSATTWNDEIIGIDPAGQHLSVAAVLGTRQPAGTTSACLDRFRTWGWRVTVLPSDAPDELMRRSAEDHDVVLFIGMTGSRRRRRAVSACVPTVTTVERAGVLRMLAEAVRRRSTTVMVVSRTREARILRAVTRSALVLLDESARPQDFTSGLGCVLLRARSWWR